MTASEQAHVISLLRPGDVLLYSGTSIFSWGIKVKTFSRFSHVEVFERHDGKVASGGYTVASRDGQGVNRYEFTTKNLRAVLRPILNPSDPLRAQLDMAAGILWFETEAKGQPYDWLGLFAFFNAAAQGSTKKAMFCSEFMARFFKKCRYWLFKGDSDAVAPGMCWTCSDLGTVWQHPDEPTRNRDLDW